MIYLYLFGTCFHFIYVFMIIGDIDLLQAGVGGNTSWNPSGMPLEKYRLTSKEYVYNYKIIPIKTRSDVNKIYKTNRYNYL